MNVSYTDIYLIAPYLTTTYFEGAAGANLAMQVDRQLGAVVAIGAQAERRIDQPQTVASQVDRQVVEEAPLAVQVSRALEGATKSLDAQVDRQVASEVGLAMEASSGTLRQGSCAHEGYATRPYLTAPYLTEFVCAALGMQVERRPLVRLGVNSQVERRIVDAPRGTLMQAERQVTTTLDTLMQVQAVSGKILPMQVRKVLYNTYNIRILSDFPSRGASGTNWTVTVGSQASGDFSPNNLNTDIVEQVFRTQGTSNVSVVCDTQVSSGVYVDTLAIMNHNLRSTGTVRVDAAMTPAFSNPLSFTLTPNATPNMFWVAPTLPLEAFRYWRFTFNDAGNPDGFLQVGTIVFGSALIFQGENCVDTIIRTPKHFADKVQTEGFTAVSNDRALRYSLGLEFRNLDYTRENYGLLQQVFGTCRTSLKALWMPTPRTPERFAVFGKLAAIPSEQHNSKGADADYVSFTLEVDESL